MFLKISKNIIDAEARALLLLSKSLDTNYNKILSLVSKVNGNIIQSVDLVAVNNIQRKGIIISTLESLIFYVYSFFMQDEIN